MIQFTSEPHCREHWGGRRGAQEGERQAGEEEEVAVTLKIAGAPCICNQKGCRRVFLVHLFPDPCPSCFSQVRAVAVALRPCCLAAEV